MSLRFPEIVDTKGASEMCGFSRQRIHQLIRDGRFPKPDVKVGSHPFWHRASIYAFLDTWTSPSGTARKGLPRSESVSSD